ncbi:uncharacterized protein CCOS01_06697 [Colletotrichum costaricense]|uniref:Uncharacterized protein n=1 Tax=Colletotrichum costaricense TaxID=1209916 RepID=A0AAI9YZ04_9PEZI|nr:uncharacterized protein CCOS01_06697 [Colletotrichum costaricense]KAK1528863.1 hypothetical protein CCOS01_06697 [Colletotrichum costaricense]
MPRLSTRRLRPSSLPLCVLLPGLRRYCTSTSRAGLVERVRGSVSARPFQIPTLMFLHPLPITHNVLHTLVLDLSVRSTGYLYG